MEERYEKEKINEEELIGRQIEKIMSTTAENSSEDGKKGRGLHNCDYEFPEFPDHALCGFRSLYESGTGLLWRCHFFQDNAAHDRGYDLYGASCFRLRTLHTDPEQKQPDCAG